MIFSIFELVAKQLVSVKSCIFQITQENFISPSNSIILPVLQCGLLFLSQCGVGWDRLTLTPRDPDLKIKR